LRIVYRLRSIAARDLDQSIGAVTQPVTAPNKAARR
jgi:hypothetical protein